ncbi:hypothetical protein QOT17_023394 [Balamuthia mandrillaris]
MSTGTLTYFTTNKNAPITPVSGPSNQGGRKRKAIRKKSFAAVRKKVADEAEFDDTLNFNYSSKQLDPPSSNHSVVKEKRASKRQRRDETANHSKQGAATAAATAAKTSNPPPSPSSSSRQNGAQAKPSQAKTAATAAAISSSKKTTTATTARTKTEEQEFLLGLRSNTKDRIDKIIANLSLSDKNKTNAMQLCKKFSDPLSQPELQKELIRDKRKQEAQAAQQRTQVRSQQKQLETTNHLLKERERLLRAELDKQKEELSGWREVRQNLQQLQKDASYNNNKSNKTKTKTKQKGKMGASKEEKEERQAGKQTEEELRLLISEEDRQFLEQVKSAPMKKDITKQLEVLSLQADQLQSTARDIRRFDHWVSTCLNRVSLRYHQHQFVENAADPQALIKGILRPVASSSSSST